MRISVVPGQLAYPLPERVGGWPGAPARRTTCRGHPAYIPRRAAAPSRSASYALRACTVRSSQIRDSYQRWGLYGAAVAGHRLLMVLRGHLRGTTRQGPLAVSSEPARLPAGNLGLRTATARPVLPTRLTLPWPSRANVHPPTACRCCQCPPPKQNVNAHLTQREQQGALGRTAISSNS
jgi:hypothetical protein